MLSFNPHTHPPIPLPLLDKLFPLSAHRFPTLPFLLSPAQLSLIFSRITQPDMPSSPYISTRPCIIHIYLILQCGILRPLYTCYKHASEFQIHSFTPDLISSSSSSFFFFSGLPQMLPQLEPPALQEPLVQMEPLLANLPVHPIPPATAGYSRHRPKSKR